MKTEQEISDQILELLKEAPSSQLFSILLPVYRQYKTTFQEAKSALDWEEPQPTANWDDTPSSTTVTSFSPLKTLSSIGFVKLKHTATQIFPFQQNQFEHVITVGTSNGTILQYRCEISNPFRYTLIEKRNYHKTNTAIATLFYNSETAMLTSIGLDSNIVTQSCYDHSSQLKQESYGSTTTQIPKNLASIFVFFKFDHVGFVTTDNTIGFFHLQHHTCITKKWKQPIRFIIPFKYEYQTIETTQHKYFFLIVDRYNKIVCMSVDAKQHMEQLFQHQCNDEISAAAISPDNSLVTIGFENGSLVIFELKLATQTMEKLYELPSVFSTKIVLLDYNPTKYWLLIVVDSEIAMIDLETKTYLYVHSFERTKISCATFSKDGIHLWIACENGKLHVFDVETTCKSISE